MWTYALICSKKFTYICIAKDESCEYSQLDLSFVQFLLPSAKNICEGVYRLPLDFDSIILIANKFKLDDTNGRASTVLDYCKKCGMLSR